MKVNRKRWVPVLAIIMTSIFMGQLVAGVGFTADLAHAGPKIAVVKMAHDENVEWAEDDILTRLDSFVDDDPFIRDRITVYDVDTREELSIIDGDIIVYLSHGGKKGLMLGEGMLTWEEMAEFVMKSDAPLHLFAACKSKEIIKFGDDDSGKKLYTVPGIRAAEITNIEISAVAMLALGIDAETVDDYRTTELTKAKELLESGESYHPMDFDTIIINEIDAIEAGYADQYDQSRATFDPRYYKHSDTTSITTLGELPSRIRDLLNTYYGTAVSVGVDYTISYYTRETHEIDFHIDANPLDGMCDTDDCWIHVVGGPDTGVETGSSYSGTITFDAFTVTLTASKDSDGNLQSIMLEQDEEGGVYISQNNVDGVWEEPQVGRTHERTGGFWTDSYSTTKPEQYWPTPFEGWQFRKSHTITGSQDAGANYQIHFTLHYGSGVDSGEHVYLNSHSQNDFDDVRFVDDDENTLLDYWMESCDTGNQATFWVEVKDNLNYDQTIHVYYGNSEAVSASDGEATFLFYDDFDGTSLDSSKWTVDQGAVEVSNGQMHVDGAIGSNKAYFYSTEGWRENIKQEVRAIVSTPHPCAMRCASFIDTDYGWNDFIDGQFYHASYSNYFRSRTANDFQIGGAYSDFEYNQLNDITQWHVYSVYWIPGEVGWAQDDSVFVVRTQIPQDEQMWIPEGKDMSVFFSEAGVIGDDMDVDWVRVRKFIANEPDHGQWSAEDNLLDTYAWNYRKLHTISGFTGAGTDYQIKLLTYFGSGIDSENAIFLGSKCKTNFADLRFTSADGVTKLDYWIESYSSSSVATIWIEVKSNLNVDRNIYIYFGNENATSESDGEATFLFFDDFDGTSLDSSKWTIDQGAVEVSNGLLHADGAIGGNKAYFYSNEGWGENIKQEVRAIVSTPHPCAMRCASFIDTDYGWNDFIDGQFYHASYSNYFRSRTANDFQIGGGYTDFVYDSMSDITNWHVYSVYWIPGEVGWAQDDDVFVVHNTLVPDGNEDLSVLFSEAGVIGDDMDVDWVFVRKYMGTEPVPEETGLDTQIIEKLIPSAFTVSQLDTFSVDFSLLHNSIGNVMSTTSINLYDDNDVLALSLQIIDDDSYQTQDLVAGYFWTDNADFEHEEISTLSDISGDFSGTLTIRFDPYQGVIVKLPGQSEVLVQSLVSDQSDLCNRLIKYMTIESSSIGSNPMHETELDVAVSYAFSEYTVFEEDCEDMNGFIKDLSLDTYLVGVTNLEPSTSDGSIVPEENYLSLTSVASGMFWHGPAYVKPLDRPFRLYQLTEFSVDMELLAGASSQGAMQVALFDDSMNIVLGITIGDPSSSATSLMSTGYWPTVNPGDCVSYQSSYMSGDVRNTGKLWFDGSDVQSSIEGVGTQELYTSSLITDATISYLVIYGAGYGSEPLSEMRVHDISIQVDLDAVDPSADPPAQGEDPEPVECDGTTVGVVTEQDAQNAENELIDADQYTRIYPTGPWPTLHYVILSVVNPSVEIVHYAIDILGVLTELANDLWDMVVNWMEDIFDYFEPLLNQFFEAGVEIAVLYFAYPLVLAAWVLVDYLKLCDVSGTVFLACLITASLGTISLVGIVHALAEIGVSIFGYDMGVAVWFILILFLAFSLFTMATGGVLSAPAKVVAVSYYVSSVFGPFSVMTLWVNWWSWASLAFVLGLLALSCLRIKYYLDMAAQS